VLEGQLAGALQAEYAGVAGLAVGGIGASAFAEHSGLAGDIEDVVLDLKRQADFIAVTAQGVADLVSHRARRQRTEQHAGPDQGTGLAPVHLLEAGGVSGAAGRIEVECLPAGHALRSDGLGQHDQHLQFCTLGEPRRAACEHREGQSLQGITGQYRGPFIEGAVAARAPATQIVVVHRRQVIMNQAVGVDELHGGGGSIETVHRSPKRRAGDIHQERAQPLAAVQYAVAHGRVQPRRRRVARGERCFQDTLDPGLRHAQLFLESAPIGARVRFRARGWNHRPPGLR